MLIWVSSPCKNHGIYKYIMRSVYSKIHFNLWLELHSPSCPSCLAIVCMPHHGWCHVKIKVLIMTVTCIKWGRNDLPASIWSSPYPTSRPHCRSVGPCSSPTTWPFSESWLDHGHRTALQLAQGQWEVWVWKNYGELGVGTWAKVASLGHGTPAWRRMTTLLRLEQMSYKKERI